ncbi:MAG: hypothetical protein AAGI38_22870 [Bacteroidota bacterium]
MSIFQIEIIDPKAKKLLENLAEMNLIKIQEVGNPKERFFDLLNKLRSNEKEISLEEITREVELVRAQRNIKDGSHD